MITENDTCMRCGKSLNHEASTWLELSFRTGLYAESVPAEESQGGFEFGSDCARAILKNGGKLTLVGRAARFNR